VADYLFTRFPNGDEGLMTKLRSRIVKRKTLDYLAGKVGIPRLITAGISPGNKSKHLYGNVLEALVGAIFLDRGYAPARRFFVAKVLKRHVDLEQLVQKDPDHKSRIIEWAQKNRIEVVFKSREEHLSGGKRPSFVSSVLVNGEKKGIGRGASKKDAEQVAAKEALKNVHSLP
jgi:ribonuclease-3